MKTKSMPKPKKQLLLLEDVEGLGRSGDIVSAKAGYIRNFLFPQKKAVVADKSTLTLQAKLKEEREKKAIVDRKEAEELSLKLADIILITKVKVDPEGKMYGSVTSHDIAKMMQEKGYDFRRQNVMLSQPIKTVGRHIISLKLKEGVTAKVVLDVEQEISQDKEENVTGEKKEVKHTI
jgi:large subunit ribosomal protein L9